MQIEHCAAQCGSVVQGLQLAQTSLDDVKDLRELLFQRGVLFFRDQVLYEREHLAFAKRFGDIVVNKFFGIVPGYPEIAEVRKEPDQTMNIGGGWHTDHSYDPDPALGSILVARELPETGGDTHFTNTQAAFALLHTLYEHAQQPEFQCRFSWRPGSVAIWDNRLTWHLAENDYHGERRLMHRITIAGSELAAAA